MNILINVVYIVIILTIAVGFLLTYKSFKQRKPKHDLKVFGISFTLVSLLIGISFYLTMNNETNLHLYLPVDAFELGDECIDQEIMVKTKGRDEKEMIYIIEDKDGLEASSYYTSETGGVLACSNTYVEYQEVKGGYQFKELNLEHHLDFLVPLYSGLYFTEVENILTVYIDDYKKHLEILSTFTGEIVEEQISSSYTIDEVEQTVYFVTYSDEFIFSLDEVLLQKKVEEKEELEEEKEEELED